jgi:UDP-2-acetamido-3-amino-2,3-dideoxy-glucuronate N-acetyltransferase
MADHFIHPLADCQSAHIGRGTKVWQFSVILEGARIGNNCNINAHCFIENDVIVGDNVTIKCGVYLWDGLRVEDNVFIGPSATLTNAKYPRSKAYPKSFPEIIIRQGASIGAMSIILPGLEIGEYALVAAGALVTKNVPARTLAIGSPARMLALPSEAENASKS